MNLFQRLLNKRKKVAEVPETQKSINSYKKTETKEPETAQETKEPETVQYWCDRFNDAKEKGDADEMKKALMNAYHKCGSKNSMCLHEMFCPECPMGGMPVSSGRAGT